MFSPKDQAASNHNLDRPDVNKAFFESHHDNNQYHPFSLTLHFALTSSDLLNGQEELVLNLVVTLLLFGISYTRYLHLIPGHHQQIPAIFNYMSNGILPSNNVIHAAGQ